MSSADSSQMERQLQHLLRPERFVAQKSFLENRSLALVIWDILLGIPFSLVIALLNKASIQWFGYEKIMRCPSGIFASRAIMVLINLGVVWCWRKQLLQEEREERVRAEINMLDGVIACLEKVLADVEVREVEEQ